MISESLRIEQRRRYYQNDFLTVGFIVKGLLGNPVVSLIMGLK